jgi:hypothetical protein
MLGSFSRSYLEPLAWGLVAQQAANLAGLDPTTQAITGVVGVRGGKAGTRSASRPLPLPARGLASS